MPAVVMLVMKVKQLDQLEARRCDTCDFGIRRSFPQLYTLRALQTLQVCSLAPPQDNYTMISP